MDMFMLLLVSAAALLVSPVAASPVKFQALNPVIEAVSKYNTSFYKEYFVEDVTQLADACNDTFYCKVQQILNDHRQITAKDNGVTKVLRTLGVYISNKNINCDDVLKNVTKSDIKTPLPVLLENLTKCCKQSNLNGHKTTI